MNKVFNRDEQIITRAAETIGVRDARELVSDDEKILVYGYGATYWINKRDLYEPFAKKGGTE
jgi:hypothetical protein